MLASEIPARIQKPFADTGTKNTIPVPSQISITPGAASFTDGFPPLTFTALSAGGIPPDGGDMNGILNQITAVQQWQSAGGIFSYDSAFSTAIGGYPAGAILQSSDGLSQWLNLTDDNLTDPDDVTSVGWVAIEAYGITAVTGLTNVNVTLTPAQYRNGLITLAGTLTGNVQIIFPTHLRRWLVINNTTGGFSVTCKTAAGTGYVADAGVNEQYCDGTNIVSLNPPAPSGVRQTVDGGPVNSNGFAAFGGSTGGTGVTAVGTLYLTAANGLRNLRGVAVNPAWTGLNAFGDGIRPLYLDIAPDGSCVSASAATMPVYQEGGAYSTTSGQFTFNIQEMTGKVGNGASSAQTYRVAVGEVTVSGNVVTAIVWYALNGRYMSAETTGAASTTTSFNHNIGVPARQIAHSAKFKWNAATNGDFVQNAYYQLSGILAGNNAASTRGAMSRITSTLIGALITGTRLDGINSTGAVFTDTLISMSCGRVW